MAALDWIALAIVAISLLVGMWRGLIFETFSLVGWLLAFWGAYTWAEDLAAVLPMGQSAQTWRLVAAFVLIFLAVVFASSLLASMLRKLLSVVGLGPADRALGGLFGAARAVLLLLALTVVVRLAGLDGEPWWKESRSSEWLAQGLAYVEPLLPEAMGQWLEKGKANLPLDSLPSLDRTQDGQPTLHVPL